MPRACFSGSPGRQTSGTPSSSSSRFGFTCGLQWALSSSGWPWSETGLTWCSNGESTKSFNLKSLSKNVKSNVHNILCMFLLSSSGFCLGRGLIGGSTRRLIMQTLFLLTLSSTPWPVRLGQVRNSGGHKWAAGASLTPHSYHSPCIAYNYSWDITWPQAGYVVIWLNTNQFTNLFWHRALKSGNETGPIWRTLSRQLI